MTTTQIDLSDVARVGKYLKDVEPEVYKQIAREMRESGRSIAANVAYNIKPTRLTRWHDSGRQGPSRLPGFHIGTAQAGVKSIASPTGRRKGNTVQILRVQQMDGGGAVMDSAGNRRTTQFSMNLDANSTIKASPGKIRSRSMYKGTKNAMRLVEQSVGEAIEMAEEKIAKAIIGGY